MKGTLSRLGVLALILAGVLGPTASAQAPAARAKAARPRSQPRRQAYPPSYSDDRTAGFRNPNGVGRYEEYYPPGNTFQLNQVRVHRVPTFNGGNGMPTVQDQIAAQRLGVMKANAIQQNINSYARPYYPYYGYGFGGGFGGGFYGGFL